MSYKIKESCIYCYGDVYYRSEEQLIKCPWCGETLIVAKFENELTRLQQTREENQQIKKALEEAEKEKQAADDRLFAALSNLDSLDGKQGEILDLLRALQSDTAEGQDALADTLRVLASGQQDADGKLTLLQEMADRLLASQGDFLQMSLTQADILKRLYEMEMDAQQRQTLAQNFVSWMQHVSEKDTEKLRQISQASGDLLAGQKKIEGKVDALRCDASRLQQSIEQFESKWESAKLQELHQLYHQAIGFQQDKAFDKAEKYYHMVLTKGGEDAEVYWRLILCHYCLFYQKDDDDRFIPIILNPDLTDPDEMSLRKELMGHLTEENRAYYLGELAKVDRILDKYRQLKSQVQYDVFLSVKQNRDGHFTVDSDVAANLYDFLVDRGLRVFNSRRTTIPAGQEYEPYIISALMSAKVMIVVGTNPDNMNAQWVKNEWSRYQWLQRREKQQTGKTDRVLICYLAKNMQARDIPKALNPDKQAILDGVKAHDELLTSLAFLMKEEPAKAEPAQNAGGEKDFHRVINQMTFWLVQGKYQKVLETYEQLTDTGLYLTRTRLHMAALCARNKVSSIQKLVNSDLVLEETVEYQAAVILCRDEEEKKKLGDLLVQNREWRSKADKTASNAEAEQLKAESKADSREPKTDLQNPKSDPKAKSNNSKTETKTEQKDPKAESKTKPQGKNAIEWKRLAKEAAGRGDYAEALRCYREGALKGSSVSQYNLGLLYEKGKGTPVDYSEAVTWYLKAAEQDLMQAQEALAICLDKGQGVPKNEKEAFSWHKKAADKGYAEAQYNLGVSYFLGRGVSKDEGEAERWFRKAAAQKHIGAANWLKEIDKKKKEQAQKAQAEEAQKKQAKQKTKENEQQAGERIESWFQQGRKLKYGLGVPKNEKEAVSWLQRAAMQGHANAQNELGLCYDMGVGLAVNKAEAVKWYKKAADQGLPAGQHNYALMLQQGTGIIKNEAEAVKWYRKSAENGFREGQNRLGLCYDLGKGVPVNKAEAVKWYKKAADQGLPIGQHNYALMLQTGTGITQNEAEAVKWYRKSAENGSPEGQNRLGLCYSMGTGVAVDKAEAVKWYKKAADQGLPWGQHNYGYMLQQGTGITKNEAEAVEWFKKSAKADLPSAQNRLGLCYQLGKGVKKDLQEAHYWYEKAALNGDLWGQCNHGVFLETGIGGTQNKEMAVYWYRKAAEGGLADAQYRLGLCYENGIGVAADKETAKIWHQKAADQGHQEAQKRLKKLNKKGWFS